MGQKTLVFLITVYVKCGGPVVNSLHHYIREFGLHLIQKQSSLLIMGAMDENLCGRQDSVQ